MPTLEQLKQSVAYCGLVCGFCSVDNICTCRSATQNHCGHRLSAAGCRQFECCVKNGLAGCWECADAPCGEDMLAPHKIKQRAFIRCIREEGLDAFCGYLLAGLKKGLVYHRDAVTGDYDLETEEEVLALLRSNATA